MRSGAAAAARPAPGTEAKIPPGPSLPFFWSHSGSSAEQTNGCAGADRPPGRGEVDGALGIVSQRPSPIFSKIKKRFDARSHPPLTARFTFRRSPSSAPARGHYFEMQGNCRKYSAAWEYRLQIGFVKVSGGILAREAVQVVCFFFFFLLTSQCIELLLIK